MTILMIGEGKVGLNSWAWIRRPSSHKFDNIKNSCLSFAGAQSPIKPSVAVYGKVTETPVIEQLYGGVLGESNFVIFDNEGENGGIIALQNCSILYR